MPCRCHSIDERMVKFSGHSIMKQYIKHKPIKCSFKMWIRAPSKTGYVYESKLCTGKKTEGYEKSSLGLGKTLVLSLSQPITNKGCILAFISFPIISFLLYLLWKDYTEWV